MKHFLKCLVHCNQFLSQKQPHLRPATLLEKRPWHWCFPVNFAKFLRTPFPQKSSRRLLLNHLDENEELL